MTPTRTVGKITKPADELVSFVPAIDKWFQIRLLSDACKPEAQDIIRRFACRKARRKLDKAAKSDPTNPTRAAEIGQGMLFLTVCAHYPGARAEALELGILRSARQCMIDGGGTEEGIALASDIADECEAVYPNDMEAAQALFENRMTLLDEAA